MADKTFTILTELSLNSDEFKAGTAKVKQNVKDLMTGVEGATGNINEMRKALMSLKNISFAGKTKEEIKAITTQIGRLEDSIGDLRAQSKAMGTELGTQVAGSLQAVSAGVELVVGSISLFGGSNETIEKLNKVMITMIGITQALGVIEDALATKKLQMTAIRIKDAAVASYENVVRWASVTSSNAAIAAETARAALSGKMTIATRIATAAQWLWNAALAANPIGLIIVAVAALTAAIYGLVKAYQAWTKAKKDNEAVTPPPKTGGVGGKFGNGTVTEDISAMSSDAIEQYIKVMQARGDKTSEVINAEIILLRKRASETLQSRRNMKLETDETAEEFEKRRKQYSEDLTNYENLIETKKIEYQKAREEEGKTDTDYTKRLNDNLSQIEDTIKNTIAAGGVVTPEMLKRLDTARRKVQDLNTEYERLLKLSYGRDDAATVVPKKLTPKGTGGAVSDLKTETPDIQVDKLNAYATAAKNAAEKQQVLFDKSETGWAKMTEGITATETLMSTLGTALDGITEGLVGVFDGTKGAFKDVVTTILQGTSQIINALLAQAIAAMIAKEAYKGLLGLALAAVGVSLLLALWKSKVPEFATGGIVPGRSYSGDNVPIMANSGEMILNAAQQRNLFSLINNGGVGGGSEVTFRINGTELIGVMNNYSRKLSYTR